PNYDPGKPAVTTPWYATQGAAERQADLDFIKGMRPHHAGALTMSDEYLKDKSAANTQLLQLAKGIIHNQAFEIGMLDRVDELVGKPIHGERERRQIAEQGLAQKQRFVRAPMPGLLFVGNRDVSKRDVQFAKAMIVHHQGALDMAKDYLANPAATNKYLRLLCVDILTDQKQEIDFMKDVIARYPGNPDDVKIDASMIHGMEGMNHGGHGGHHDTKAATKKPSHAAPHNGGHAHH
ncbi:MAG: DUF305 domain-containing protein, partial [Micavibrio aeruginosavorus]